MEQNEKKLLRWSEFAVKGSGGAIRNWHLVSREEKGYRSACGRLLTETPEAALFRAPDDVRGVCRRCIVCSRKASVPSPLRR